jgi:hypothetical protein
MPRLWRVHVETFAQRVELTQPIATEETARRSDETAQRPEETAGAISAQSTNGGVQ